MLVVLLIEGGPGGMRSGGRVLDFVCLNAGGADFGPGLGFAWCHVGSDDVRGGDVRGGGVRGGDVWKGVR